MYPNFMKHRDQSIQVSEDENGEPLKCAKGAIGERNNCCLPERSIFQWLDL